MTKVALVLGGGGARGLAHLGVLKSLEKAGVKIDLVVGCSFGALVGAMYAQSRSSEAVETRLRAFLETDAYHRLGIDKLSAKNGRSEDYFGKLVRNLRNWVILNVGAQRPSLLKSDRLEGVTDFLLDEMKIEDCAIPFACNATDLISGSAHLFTEGDLRTAVRSSMTIPGIFPPVAYRQALMVDGAVTYNLPVRFARALGADYIIAVDIHPVLDQQTDFGNVFSVMLRTRSITANTLSEETLGGADTLIAPPVKEYFWYDFQQSEALIAAGETAALHHLDDIKKDLQPVPARYRHRNRVRRAFRRFIGN